MKGLKALQTACKGYHMSTTSDQMSDWSELNEERPIT